MALSFWTDADTDWDTLVLGGRIWPGTWEITGQGVQRKIDLKKSKGSDQATLKDEGYKNATLTAKGTLWTAEQFRELQSVLPEVHPRRKGGDRQPLSIVHPQANLLGVDSVYLRSIGIPKLDRSKGGPLTIELGFIEWVPKPKKVRNASGTGTGCGKIAANAAAAAAKVIADNAATIAALDPTNADAATAAALTNQAWALAAAHAATVSCGGKGNTPKDDAVKNLNDELDAIEDDMLGEIYDELRDGAAETVRDAIDALSNWGEG